MIQCCCHGTARVAQSLVAGLDGKKHAYYDRKVLELHMILGERSSLILLPRLTVPMVSSICSRRLSWAAALAEGRSAVANSTSFRLSRNNG
jgi:hypothetical protein